MASSQTTTSTTSNSDTKTKFQLSINNKIKKTAKFIALKNDTTVSALFEDYIKAIDKNPNIIKLIKDSIK